MARRRRFRIPGLPYHVVQRGNNRVDIFRATDDYQLFVALLRHTLDVVGLEIHAYVLMRNHFHLLVTPLEPTSLERAMHRIDFQYARYINDRYKRTGTAFEGRYRCTAIDSESYWYRCMRYVELNPVRAGIVADPAAYTWSSYHRHALGTPDPLVTVHPLYTALATSPKEREAAWRRYCAEALPPEELETLRLAVHTGGVLGRLVVPEDGANPEKI